MSVWTNLVLFEEKLDSKNGPYLEQYSQAPWSVNLIHDLRGTPISDKNVPADGDRFKIDRWSGNDIFGVFSYYKNVFNAELKILGVEGYKKTLVALWDDNLRIKYFMYPKQLVHATQVLNISNGVMLGKFGFQKTGSAVSIKAIGPS